MNLMSPQGSRGLSAEELVLTLTVAGAAGLLFLRAVAAAKLRLEAERPSPAVPASDSRRTPAPASSGVDGVPPAA